MFGPSTYYLANSTVLSLLNDYAKGYLAAPNRATEQAILQAATQHFQLALGHLRGGSDESESDPKLATKLVFYTGVCTYSEGRFSDGEYVWDNEWTINLETGVITFS